MRLRIEEIRHQSADERLGNGLVEADRERTVVVGHSGEGRWNEKCLRARRIAEATRASNLSLPISSLMSRSGLRSPRPCAGEERRDASRSSASWYETFLRHPQQRTTVVLLNFLCAKRPRVWSLGFPRIRFSLDRNRSVNADVTSHDALTSPSCAIGPTPRGPDVRLWPMRDRVEPASIVEGTFGLTAGLTPQLPEGRRSALIDAGACRSWSDISNRGASGCGFRGPLRNPVREACGSRGCVHSDGMGGPGFALVRLTRPTQAPREGLPPEKPFRARDALVRIDEEVRPRAAPMRLEFRTLRFRLPARNFRVPCQRRPVSWPKSMVLSLPCRRRRWASTRNFPAGRAKCRRTTAR